MSSQPAYVAVIGPGDGASAAEIELARQVGRLLAERGVILVCGGLGGVMAAACEGAAERGGLTVGLLPGNDRGEGNRCLTVALPTGIGELRNGLVVRASDAVIAIGGSWGTLSEIAIAKRAGTPVIGLEGWAIEGRLANTAGSPQEAVNQALAAGPRN
jgi:uncharacterized protein (TIGR00725 family)